MSWGHLHLTAAELGAVAAVVSQLPDDLEVWLVRSEAGGIDVLIPSGELVSNVRPDSLAQGVLA